MSQAENLLNSLTGDQITTFLANASAEPHIVIGEDRVVIVPDSLKRIAVQHDHHIETVTFDCPRYWDEHDMSKMGVYINYLPPNGVIESCIATNVRVDSDDPSIMHFDWTITENVTAMPGNLVFLVDIKHPTGDHWHSELCKDMFISEGLEPPPILPELGNPDILTQVLLFQRDVTELNRLTLTRASIYVGSGEMPPDCNVQIDPQGDNYFEEEVKKEVDKYLNDYAPAVYIGDGEMPPEYNIQINPDGDASSGVVTSVNGATPDEFGNVQIEIDIPTIDDTKYVKSVNDIKPDGYGNVDLKLNETLKDYLKVGEGGTMTAKLVAKSDDTGEAQVRNIGFGAALPETFNNGDIFILLPEEV